MFSPSTSLFYFMFLPPCNVPTIIPGTKNNSCQGTKYILHFPVCGVVTLLTTHLLKCWDVFSPHPPPSLHPSFSGPHLAPFGLTFPCPFNILQCSVLSPFLLSSYILSCVTHSWSDPMTPTSSFQPRPLSWMLISVCSWAITGCATSIKPYVLKTGLVQLLPITCTFFSTVFCSNSTNIHPVIYIEIRE